VNNPFPIRQTDREKAVATLMAIIESGSPADAVEACSVLVEMQRANTEILEHLQDQKPEPPAEPWNRRLGRPSDN
jgi:hypothetical protein